MQTFKAFAVLAFIVVVIVVAICETFGSYIAGQGDAPAEARRWAEKFAPGAAVECSRRDSDSNGYVSCTVGVPGGQVTPIECGVNRWYLGYGIDTCRFAKGYAGRVSP